MSPPLTQFPPELEALASIVPDPTSVFSTPAQLDTELITLTLLPRARWQTLLNLDIISVRCLPSFLPPSSVIGSSDHFCSNATNRRNLPRYRRKHRSSCLRSQESRVGLISTLLPTQVKESRRRRPTGWRKIVPYKPRASLCDY